jgi:hypothetical protein
MARKKTGEQVPTEESPQFREEVISSLHRIEGAISEVKSRLPITVQVGFEPSHHYGPGSVVLVGVVEGVKVVNPRLGSPSEPEEKPVEPWKHLVRRYHPWRQQLYLKGQNLTARQLVGGMKANGFDLEAAASNYRVPQGAVLEALRYVEENRELLEKEAEIERLMLQRGGVARGPRPVP